MSKFQDLLLQIEYFIKKYYKNEMVKGVLLFLSIFFFSFLVVTSFEYFGRFNGGIRAFLFFTFLVCNIFILGKYIIFPLLKLVKVGNRLSLQDASKMIGKLFPDISDKLENTLQLKSQLELNSGNVELLHASINQKANSLSVVPFTTGIHISENKKFLKYLLPIAVIILLVLVIRPSIFSDGSKRIMYYSTEFKEQAPFEFILQSPDTIMQGQGYELQIKLKGNEIPSEVKLYSNNGRYNLRKKNAILFEHQFANLDQSLEFYCEANGFKSEPFKINVLQKPKLDEVLIKLNYPKHMGMANEKITDISDLTIPTGTLVEWVLKSSNTSKIKSVFEDSARVLLPNTNQEFVFKNKIKKSQNYQLLFSTKQIENADTLTNQIIVTPDLYPTITVNEQIDSIQPFVRFFTGNISDDYGFGGLTSVIKITRKDSIEWIKTKIGISSKITTQIFSHSIDLKQYNLKPGNQMVYYFVVSDNDAPSGYKSSSSTVLSYKVPELSDLENQLSKKSDALKKEMDDALSKSKELKKEITEIKNNLINKSAPDWKDKQSIDNMLNMQQNLQKQLEKLQQKFDEKAQEENEFLDNSDELKEKQELLQKLMDELMDDEMKALLEELQKLMDELNKDQILENMEKMEQKSENLENELDRTLELLKNLELDKKIENIEDQLRELSEEQKSLEEKTKNKEDTPENLKEKQEKLNEKFDEIKKDIEQAKEMNQELEKPNKLDFKEEDQKGIDEEMDNAKENLEKSKEKKASENQKKASEMMEQMADDINAMKSSSEMEQETEDMEKLRFLLENVVALSHQQEALMKDYKKIDNRNPLLIDYNRTQLKIIKSTEIVKDSLIALAKRHAQLSNTILEELNNLKYNQTKAKEYGHERRINNITQHQQYAVTAYNDLALLLAEVLEQMQNQMKAKMPGSGQCDKPGGSGSGSPSSKMSMQQMKDQLKKQMQKMKGGSNPGGKGGKKPGEGMGMGKQGEGNGGIPGLSAKEIAKMAMQQAQMRKALEGIRQELNKDGSGSGNGLNDLIKDLKDLENDLLNNGYTNNTFKRQQDIMTKLLESEKAILERGYSEERESKEGKNEEESNQIKLLEYNHKKEAEIELLRSVPVGLKVYYKNMVNNYFNSVNN